MWRGLSWNLKRKTVFLFRHLSNPSPLSPLTGVSPVSQSLSRPLFHVSEMGHLSESSVMGTIGGTSIHVAICSQPTRDSHSQGLLLPLTVDYRNRAAASGRFPRNAQKRDRHGTDEEILASRIIDRAIRPLFPKGYVDTVHITVTSQSIDGVFDPVVLAVNTVSYALMCSKQPWAGPIACVRIGYLEGELIVNPSVPQLQKSSLDLLYAGLVDRCLMIETIAKEVPDEILERAFNLANEETKRFLNIQSEQLALLQAPTERKMSPPSQLPDQMIWHREYPFFSSTSRLVYFVPPDLEEYCTQMGYQICLETWTSLSNLPRSTRSQKEGQLRSFLFDSLSSHPIYSSLSVISRELAVDALLKKTFRHSLQNAKKRVDGRGISEIRQLKGSCDVLSIPHGSSFFQRGDTHVLASVTLGPRSEVRITDSLFCREPTIDQFTLQYDFPPYCTGEVGNATLLNRRMLGHGKLAERAVVAVIPHIEDFPYSIRVLAECTSSSGSSSMASVCAASLSLMDAGVPLQRHVAGLSIGLILDDDRDECGLLLTDISGTEDHYGDMDFKIAGTNIGITAMQLDVKKSGGISISILCEALERAKDGRAQILQLMKTVLASPRLEIKSSAPHAIEIRYNSDRKKYLIGPGGEMLRHIEKIYTCTVDTSVDGVAYIYGYDPQRVREAELFVQDLVIEPKAGEMHHAEVTQIKDFGLVVRLSRAHEAFLHRDELSHNKLLVKKSLGELVAVGQRLKVTIIDIDVGSILVSRKWSLKKEDAHNDVLCPTPPPSYLSPIETFPTFPVIPPRSFSVDFFLKNVVPETEITSAIRAQKPVEDRITTIKSPRIETSQARQNAEIPNATSSTNSRQSNEPELPTTSQTKPLRRQNNTEITELQSQSCLHSIPGRYPVIGEILAAKVVQLEDTHAVVHLSSSHEAMLAKEEITRHKNLLRHSMSNLISMGQSFPVKISQEKKQFPSETLIMSELTSFLLSSRSQSNTSQTGPTNSQNLRIPSSLSKTSELQKSFLPCVNPYPGTSSVTYRVYGSVRSATDKKRLSEVAHLNK